MHPLFADPVGEHTMSTHAAPSGFDMFSFVPPPLPIWNPPPRIQEQNRGTTGSVKPGRLSECFRDPRLSQANQLVSSE